MKGQETESKEIGRIEMGTEMAIVEYMFL